MWHTLIQDNKLENKGQSWKKIEKNICFFFHFIFDIITVIFFSKSDWIR